MFMVPGYCPLRTLGRFNNTGRKLELIKEEGRNFLSVSKIEKASKCGNHSLWNQVLMSHWAWAHMSARLSGSRRGPSNPQMGHSGASVMHSQQSVQTGWFSIT